MSGLESRLAFSMLRGMTAEMARHIADCGFTAEGFLDADPSESSRVLGSSGRILYDRMAIDEARMAARREIEFIGNHHIRAFFLLDDDYPWNLREAPDAPVMLYELGDTDLNATHVISFVGTRRPTAAGVETCSRMVVDLAAYFPEMVVVSGLAYGIDATAHQAALDAGVPTVAVVAHGLHTIYPAPHRQLAASIVRHGGAILSEYPSGYTPYRQRFLERNRIIAGLSQATVVVESDVKGGAMSTANMAFSYSREVLAVPGRPCDPMSSGCNSLIRRNKAALVTNAADIMEALSWKPDDIPVDVASRNLFPELDGDCKAIYDALRFSKEALSVDALFSLTLIPVARVISALGELEFDGIVAKHPGNRYSLA